MVKEAGGTETRPSAGLAFGDIRFGYADAYTEAQRDPKLLMDGFYDPMGAENKLLRDHPFLILGQKGSGKSALSVRLGLNGDSQRLVKTVMLGDFPFADFASVQSGGVTKEARYPSAWRWLICLCLLSSFERDQAAAFPDLGNFLDSLKTLRQEGWLPAESLRPLVIQNSRKANIGFNIAPLSGKSETSSHYKSLPFPAAIDTLSNLVLGFRSTTEHILVIDGLDDLIIDGQQQWDVLSALIDAVDRLNLELFQSEVEAKVLVMCRTDIFDRLPGSNTTKIRRDSSLSLNWYQDIKTPRNSHLIHMANKKASAHHPADTDVFNQFLPQNMRLKSGHSFDMAAYLLDYTRHTPRDFLQLLEYIAAACRETATRHQVPKALIESAVHNYSAEYFVGEIRNELNGLLTADEIDLTKRLLRGLRRNRFYLHELEQKVRKSTQYSGLNLQHVIERLFDAGIVGNIVGGRSATESYIRFRYRNPHQDADFDMQLVLHNAIINGFNIPRSTSGPL